MNKTFLLILTLGLASPLAAELTAPELPLIDAAEVRARIAENESLNIGAAFPGMQTCRFTAAQARTCVFTCKDGSTVTRPAIQSSLVPNGCAKFVMVPAAGTQDKAALTAADRASAREISAIAARADSPFGGLYDGNLGLSAYRLSPEAANLTLRLVKEMYPGLLTVNHSYSASGQSLVLVITSNDEPYVHMYDQDPTSGHLTPVEYFNSVDAGGPYKDAVLNSALGYDENSDSVSWVPMLNGLAGPGRATPLPLGQGSASAWWWMN